MENFNIPVPQKIKKSEIINDNFVGVSLTPEVIEKIKSLEGSEDFKIGFQGILQTDLENYARKQVDRLEIFKKQYRRMLDDLKDVLEEDECSFKYQVAGIQNANTEAEALQYLRKSNPVSAQMYDLFIKELSKQEGYKNPKLITKKTGEHWMIYITCDIEYQ
jgi:hypothetical protein